MVKRLTKIVATLGPASDSPDVIKQLVHAGVDVFRINFSHALHEKVAETIKTIRRCSAEVNRQIGILADLQGPKIRTWLLKDHKPIKLVEGNTLSFRSVPEEGDSNNVFGDSETIYTKNSIIVNTLQVGNRVLLADGEMELTVTERVSADELRVRVVRGGMLGEKKGINVPDLHLKITAMTEKDKIDCEFALHQRVEYIALSFVQTGEDLRYLKAFIKEKAPGDCIQFGELPWLISKIERPQAITNIDEIIAESDGIMVARGDMGVELNLCKVPLYQKMLIEKANDAGKVVITATQMLESMMSNSTPTRAEVSDIANAVLDGTDAVMLSGEVAVGKYPELCVRTMGEICVEAEAHLRATQPPSHVYSPKHFQTSNTPTKHIEERGTRNFNHQKATAYGAVMAANTANIHALVVLTYTGVMCRLISKTRLQKPIVTIAPHLHVCRKVALYRGVEPVHVELTRDSSVQAMAHIEQSLLNNQTLLKRGQDYVIVSGMTHLAGLTNTFMISRLGDHIEEQKGFSRFRVYANVLMLNEHLRKAVQEQTAAATESTGQAQQQTEGEDEAHHGGQW